METTQNCASSTTSKLSTQMSISVVQRHLLTVEKLRARVQQVLKCVINLHIEILVLESNVNQMLDEVKELNADLKEAQRLDAVIATLRDYNGPTIYHEWPYPLMFESTIDHADLAQILNTKHSVSTPTKTPNSTKTIINHSATNGITKKLKT